MQTINLTGTLNDDSDITDANGNMIFSFSGILHLANGATVPATRKKYDMTTQTLTVVAKDITAHIALS